MAEIALKGGKIALVDDEDYATVAKWSWRCRDKKDGHFYAVATIAKKPIYMHRFLMSPAFGQPVDHANGDGLDNRRANLRVCTTAQNQQNRRAIRSSTGFKGVTLHPSGKFQAQIKVSGRCRYLGLHATAAAAAARYDQEARALFGTFAVTNKDLLQLVAA